MDTLFLPQLLVTTVDWISGPSGARRSERVGMRGPQTIHFFDVNRPERRTRMPGAVFPEFLAWLGHLQDSDEGGLDIDIIV